MTQLDDFANHRDRDEYGEVFADCVECRSTHALGRRPADDGTAAATVCPECGATSYQSEARTYAGGGSA